MGTALAGGVCYLAGQVVSENEVCSVVSSPRGAAGRRPLEEALTALRKGALLLKHGRHGKPKVHFFRLCSCDTLLRWRGASGSVKQVRLRNVMEVVAGQTTEVFRRCPLRPSARCFSLRYRDEDGSTRTLDLTCADEQQYDLWLAGLRVVAERLRTLGTPVVAPGRAPNGAALPPTGAAAGAAGGAGPVLGAGAGVGGLSPAELARCVAGTRALQRGTSSLLAIPAAERVPCDLLAWGSAQRQPHVAPSLRSLAGSAFEECWQRRSQPALAPGGTHLDAYRAAVGRKHAAVVTATGALYTWGEGRGGKLGLGHDQDQPQPQRVRHGLEGQCVAAVACGDDCTAALTEAGELYMWGRLHADSPPQLVPLHVRGELRGRRVVQISCGPFHCAALTADGALFTWGEGFGGKLGHGDQSNRAQPAQVAAFAGRQVLSVACGVWHTAAVVSEPEPGNSPFHPAALAMQHSPLRREGSGSGAGDGGGTLGEAPAVAGLTLLGGIPPASPVHHGSLHHRNNSTSSAFSEASAFYDGQGGTLYTWGGVNESVAFGSSEKHDSNKGCLGHGEADLYRGQLLPVRVGGALDNRQVRLVAAGSHLTVAVTTGGRVYQVGVTGASVPTKNAPWEGATLPELVRGALQGFFVDEVACGMHHVVALGRPADRKSGRPAEHAPRVVFAWGRGSEGQLGVRGFEDSAAPLLVDALKGRQVLQVTCGGSNTMAVVEHNPSRWEPDSKEEAEAASRVLYALASEPKPPSGRQLRIQAPGEEGLSMVSGRRESERGGGSGGGGMGSIMRRSLSVIVTRSSANSVASAAAAAGAMSAYGSGGVGAPPNLARTSSSSVRSMGGASAAGSVRGSAPAAPSAAPHVYSLGSGYRSQPQLHRESLQHQMQYQQGKPGAAARLRSDRTASGGLASDSGSMGGGYGGAGTHRVVSLGSPSKSVPHTYSGGSGSAYGRRNTYAGGGHVGMMASARSFTALSGGGGAASFGRTSDRSSLSSWHHHRAHSDDGRAHEHEADSGGNAPLVNGGGVGGAGERTLSASDLAGGLDDMRSGSSAAALHDELAEKNRIIERLQRTLEKMQLQSQQLQAQRQQPAAAAGAAAVRDADAEQRLRESVQLSAGAFRAAQHANGGANGAHQQRPSTSPVASSGRWESLRPGASPRSLLSLSHSTGLAGMGARSSTIPEEDQQAQLAAMEQMLAKKEAHLEGQQQKLAVWAAELQRRELLLATQKAKLEGRVGGSAPSGRVGGSVGSGRVGGSVGSGRVGSAGSAAGSPVQAPIPSESPVLTGRAAAGVAPSGAAAGAGPGFKEAARQAAAAPAAAAAVSPLVRRAIAESTAVTPSGNGAVGAAAAGGIDEGGRDGGGGTPATPALPGEWQEEFEEGVYLTFTCEGGTTKLKRIRFSRSLFSADSAKQWYEAHKHLLAQPTSTPRVAGLALGATAGAGAGSSSLSSASQPGTPLALPAAQQQQGVQPQQQQGAPPAAQAPAHAPQQQHREGGALAEAAAATAEGLLHYRQTSRNLSFDARELATFHERLQQALASQQQQQQQQHGGPPGPGGLPPTHRPPSRLSQMGKLSVALSTAAEPAAAGSDMVLPESPFAAALCEGGQQQQQQQSAQASRGGGARQGPPCQAEAEAGDGQALDGEASRGYVSAQSSPEGFAQAPLPPADGTATGTATPSAPSSRQPSGVPGELAAIRSAADIASHSLSVGALDSCSSSPIRASGGSRSGSPLSKQRSTASASLAKQLSSPQSELGKAAAGTAALSAGQQQPLFTPRGDKAAAAAVGAAAAAVGAAAAAVGAAAAAGGHSRSSSLHSSPLEGGSSSQARPSSDSSGGGGSALSRLRRSLTGSVGGGKKK